MKVKIMNQAPEVADEEIERYMKFDGLLALKKAADVRRQWQVKIISGTIAVTGVILMSLYLITDQKVESNEFVKKTNEVEIAKPDNQNTPPIAPTNDEKDKNIVQEKSHSVPKVLDEKEKKKVEKIQIHETEETLVIEYQEAEPVLGYAHLYEYLNQELKYPEEALADSIQGILTVSFIINKEGKPENISIQNSLGEAFEREAILLINNMPAWKPATRNNIPTPSKISMPLTFQIKKVKIKKP
jgi:TonB family protein